MPGTAAPIGSLTRPALLEGFRRTDAVDVPSRHGQARGLTADECATVLATCLRPRRTGRGLERPKTAERRAWSTARIVALLFHGALHRSEVAALCWADVDFSDGDAIIIITVRRSKSDPTGGRADVRRLVGGCAAAVRSLHAAVSPHRTIPSSASASTRSTAASPQPAPQPGLEGRRTSHGGRVGLAVELTARGASTHAIQLAGPAAGRTPPWSSATPPASARAKEPSASTCALLAAATDWPALGPPASRSTEI